ncbi:MAG: hypothetical protein EKK62_02845 [Acidimicrobiia bacterium]|nr:MAG: hypothetical protein EKK62_02845 [Acidimicrobiia bacterium]HNK39012.1 hypothetical protein [Microthrixaceae bacterium]HNL48686.1 hypothetical protein [Microthrixaceae bacterium]
MARRKPRSRRNRGGVLGWFADHPGVLAVAVVAVLLAVGVGVAKVIADRSATSATEDRAAEIGRLLDGATPEDFLAFNAGVQREGSIARTVRDQPDFVNVRATADLSFIRFQPEGWWSGFTERCIVARVRPDGVTVAVPKSACVRVEAPR